MDINNNIKVLEKAINGEKASEKELEILKKDISKNRELLEKAKENE